MDKYIAYLIVTLSLLFISCESDDDFLQEVPETFYTAENAFTSSDQVKQVVISLYEYVRYVMCVNEYTHVLKGLGTDVLDVPQLRIAGSFSDYSKISPDHPVFSTTFWYWYKLIQKANTVLYAAELKNITWSSEEVKAYVIAQAKFFRAYAYRNLGEQFGGVPIVDDFITAPRYDFERSSRIETYQFAIDDLEAALPDLPETTEEGGRIVKGAAEHYLCELYLAMGIEMEQQGTGDWGAMYDKAIQYANLVINGGTYALMTERFGIRADEADKSVWWDLFREGNVNYQDGNTECIWAFQIEYAAYLAGDESSVLPYPRIYMPPLRLVTGIQGTAEDVGGRGVAIVQPTHYVRDLIWAVPVGEGDMRNAEHNIKRTFIYNDPDFPELFGDTVSYDVLYRDDYSRSLFFPLFMKLTTDRFIGLEQGQDRSNIFRDEYAIRLPETILLRAEAYLRKGEKQKAADDINRIRGRAHCTYRVGAAEVDLDFILDERARELFV